MFWFNWNLFNVSWIHVKVSYFPNNFASHKNMCKIEYFFSSNFCFEAYGSFFFISAFSAPTDEWMNEPINRPNKQWARFHSPPSPFFFLLSKVKWSNITLTVLVIAILSSLGWAGLICFGPDAHSLASSHLFWLISIVFHLYMKKESRKKWEGKEKVGERN